MEEAKPLKYYSINSGLILIKQISNQYFRAKAVI